MQSRIDDMLAMLESPISAIRARAVLLLGHAEHMLSMERLDQLYEDGDSATRVAVLKYLARNLPPDHIQFALKGLTDSANSVRLTALQHLITFPNTSAASSLELLLKNPNFHRHDLVIRAMGVCKDNHALWLLLSILEDVHSPYQMLAGDSISRLDARPITDHLLRLLISDDEKTVFAAILALAPVNDTGIIQPVLHVMNRWWTTSKSRIPNEAVQVLDKFRDIRIRDALLQILSIKYDVPNDYGIIGRSSAIHLLGNYSQPQVISYLVGLLQNGDSWDRNAATYAFTKMRSAKAVDALLANIVHETDQGLLMNYSYALAKLGDKRAVPVLEALMQRDPQTKASIETNLRALNPPTPVKEQSQGRFSKLKLRLRLR
ncbi:MAG: hypothetical protein H0X30_18830 [Anaerolineae bacterium]|nr:hypothetical protein [Anaerolineae bacterium]